MQIHFPRERKAFRDLPKCSSCSYHRSDAGFAPHFAISSKIFPFSFLKSSKNESTTESTWPKSPYISLSSLPDFSLPSLPEGSLASLKLSDVSLSSLPEVSLPTWPELHLPSLETIPSLSNVKIHEYVEKGIEKGIDIVAEKIVDKGISTLKETVDRPLQQNMEHMKKEVQSNLQQFVGEEATEVMEAASLIAHYRTADCRTLLNEGIQKVKSTVTTGLRKVGNALANCCCLTQLPVTT